MNKLNKIPDNEYEIIGFLDNGLRRTHIICEVKNHPGYIYIELSELSHYMMDATKKRQNMRKILQEAIMMGFLTEDELYAGIKNKPKINDF